MGLERRGNGYYFYEKKRIGNRVISTYCGRGELARLKQLLNQDRRNESKVEKESKNQSFETDRQNQAEIDQVIESFSEIAKGFEDALFLMNGYHVHERQWRRKRNANKDETEEA